MAERHVRDGNRHVANQHEIIAHLLEHGHSTDLAERLLKNLEDLLAMHEQHLAHLREEAGERSR
jgi:DNA repair protein RadC